MAQPSLHARFGWDPAENVIAPSRVTKPSGKILPSGASLTDQSFNKQSVKDIKLLTIASAEDLSKGTLCNDEVNAGSKEEFVRKIRFLAKNSSATGCHDVQDQCHKMGRSSVRQLCPVTCGCVEPWALTHRAGVFATPGYGCPDTCTQLWRRTYSEYYYYTLNTSYPCEDTAAHKWVFKGPAPVFMEAFKTYLRGVFDLIAAIPNVQYSMMNYLEEYGEIFFPGFNRSTDDMHDIVDSILDGRTLADLLEGVWIAAHGLPMLQITGCKFFTSQAVRSLWGIDLCKESSYALDIRSLCPVSCGCQYDQASIACPLSCSHGPARNVSSWTCFGDECG